MAFLRLNQPGITNLTPHQGNRDWLISRKPGGGAAVDPRLAFHALENRQGVIIGEGALSASTGSTTIYAPDASGVYQPFTDEPVWEGVDWLKYQPLATNLIQYSRDFTQGWTAAAGSALPGISADQVGIDGTANTGTTLTDAGASVGMGSNAISIAATTNPFTAVFHIKKDTDQTRFPGLVIHFGAAAKYIIAHLNTETGAVTNESGQILDDSDSVLVGDYWRVSIQGANNSQGQVIAELYPARASVFGGANDTAAQGSIVCGQIELHDNKTIAEVRGLGPIFTTTDAASTAQTVYSFDIANYDQAAAAWYVECIQAASGVITGVAGVRPWFSGGNSGQQTSVLYENLGSMNTRFWSGVSHSVTINGATSTDTLMKGGTVLHAGDNSLGLNIDGTWGTDTTYTEVVPTGPIVLGRDTAAGQYSSPIGMLFRNLRRYDITSFAEGKEIIDGLMA